MVPNTTKEPSIARYVCSFSSSINTFLNLLHKACEQLNAWIGGFQSILNRMTVSNFDWTLHALLFLHTQRVIRRQTQKRQDNEGVEEDAGVEIEREEVLLMI